ncbi:nuclear transport factor 2 family protein [Streptomyces sp. NPDC002143]
MTDLEKHKRIVEEFVTILVNENNPQKAADLHMGPRYIQHDHGTGDGKEAFVKDLSGWAERMPEQTIEVKRLIAEGDLVAVHFHHRATPDDSGMAGLDIFRIENEKLVEHWTVHMPVPTEGDPVNPNGIF